MKVQTSGCVIPASTCAAWIEAVPYTELPENRPGLAIVRALQRGRRANAKLFSLCARGNLSKNVQKRRAPVEGCAAPQNLEEPFFAPTEDAARAYAPCCSVNVSSWPEAAYQKSTCGKEKIAFRVVGWCRAGTAAHAAAAGTLRNQPDVCSRPLALVLDCRTRVY